MHDATFTHRLEISRQSQIIVVLLLAGVMALTRSHHYPTLAQTLPGASWAAFFLAGVYLRSPWALAGLIGLAAAVDYVAIAWGGVSSFCVSPAYIALIPAYGTLWFAGRWYATRYRFAPSTLLSLGLAVMVGATACELISSGSFYFYSGRFVDPTVSSFGRELIVYFPRSLQSVVFWVIVAAVVHTALSVIRSPNTNRTRIS